MEAPVITCKIEAYCPIFPSEDPNKVRIALENVILDADIEETSYSIKAFSTKLSSLEKIQEVIQSRKTQRVYKRQLKTNLIDDSTWFYLNKQAAFVGTIALCSEEEESPLGPIKIILTSKHIENIIEWLDSEAK